MKSNNTYTMRSILSINFSPVETLAIRDRKGEAFAPSTEALFNVDYKTLTATIRPFDFTIAKVDRAKFVDAIRGEYFARELTRINAEAAKFADIDEAYFAEAREEYSEAEVAKAREVVAEAKARLNVAREVVAPLAKASGALTVSAIVSAIRAEAMPAKLTAPAEVMRSEAKTLCEVAARRFSEAEVAKAREVVENKDNFGLVDVTEAEKTLMLYGLAEGDTQGLPNMKPLREAASKFVKALWQAAPAEGVQKANLTANHALTVDIFQRVKNARSVDRKGRVKSTFASADDVAREVVFAIVESMQAKARAEAKAEAKPAEAPKKGEAKPKPAPAKNAPAK